MMEKIAYCGLNCETCSAYITQQTDDQSLREKTAKAWSGGGKGKTRLQLDESSRTAFNSLI